LERKRGVHVSRRGKKKEKGNVMRNSCLLGTLEKREFKRGRGRKKKNAISRQQTRKRENLILRKKGKKRDSSGKMSFLRRTWTINLEKGKRKAAKGGGIQSLNGGKVNAGREDLFHEYGKRKQPSPLQEERGGEEKKNSN